MAELPPVAVIGAGFSGTMTALHLLARLPNRRVLLCERAPTFARGAAYSTCDPGHLLNVRAANMSPFPDRPAHFAEWLAERCPDRPGIHVTSVGTFVSRALFGRYLSSLLNESLGCQAGAERLRIIPDDVVDLEPGRLGYDVVLAGGRRHHVAGAVLAVGNLLPDQGRRPAYVDNPWVAAFAEGLDRPEPVVVIGTGLTMVDVVTRIAASGFPGPVIAISRRGLLPHTHDATAPWPVPRFELVERRSLACLLRRIRGEVAEAARQGIGWQSVVDSLRPCTAELWRGLPATEQRRFLRHLRPWWDTHRHRIAPPNGAEIGALMASGFLDLRAGRIVSVEAETLPATVTYRPRGGKQAKVLSAQRVIDATGATPARAAGDRFLAALLARRLVRLDRHGLGLDATDALALIGSAGEVTPGLWALGPVLRGTFWECTAVPDIRRQAIQMADEVAAALEGATARPASGER